MNDQTADTEPPEPTLAERLAQPLHIDFDKLADAIRTNEQGKTISDGVRELFDLIARSLRNEVPGLDEQQLGRVLLAAASATAILADDGADWTALSIVNTLASVGQRLWHCEPDDGDGAPGFLQPGLTYIDGTIFQPPEARIVFRCVAVAAHPREGEGRMAFGFASRAFPGADWTTFLVKENEWDEGWRIYRGLGLPSAQKAADPGETAVSTVVPHVYAPGTVLRTPEQWCSQYSVTVTDRSSWDGVGWDWAEPISLVSFTLLASRPIGVNFTDADYERLIAGADTQEQDDAEPDTRPLGDADV